MFVSDPQDEVITLFGKMDPTFKSWPRVDTSETFFQVHTRRLSGNDETVGVVLLGTPRAFLEFLEIWQKDDDLRIEQIVLSTPPHANRSKVWRTETLVELEVSVDRQDHPREIIYHTAKNWYREERVYGEGGGPLSTIYRSRNPRPAPMA